MPSTIDLTPEDFDFIAESHIAQIKLELTFPSQLDISLKKKETTTHYFYDDISNSDQSSADDYSADSQLVKHQKYYYEKDGKKEYIANGLTHTK